MPALVFVAGLGLIGCSSSDDASVRAKGETSGDAASTVPIGRTSTRPTTDGTATSTTDPDGPTTTRATGGQATVGPATSMAEPPVDPTTTTAAPMATPAEITEADDGNTYVAHVGDAIHLALHSVNGTRWSAPSSDDGAVLTGSGTAAPDGNASGTFSAAAKGRAHITATGDPACRSASPPCGAPSRVFTVTIVVE